MAGQGENTCHWLTALSPRSSPAGRLRDLGGDRDSSRGLPAAGRHKGQDRGAPGTSRPPSIVLPAQPAPSARRARPEPASGTLPVPVHPRPGRVGSAGGGPRSCVPARQRWPCHRRKRAGPRETKTGGGQRREGGATATKPAGTPLLPPVRDGARSSPLTAALVRAWWSTHGRDPRG